MSITRSERAAELSRQVPVSRRYQVFLKSVLSQSLWLREVGDIAGHREPTLAAVERLVDAHDLRLLVELEVMLRCIARHDDEEWATIDLAALTETEWGVGKRAVLRSFRDFIALVERWRDGRQALPTCVDDWPDTGDGLAARRSLIGFVASLGGIDESESLDAAVALMALDRIAGSWRARPCAPRRAFV